jgi:NAD(P)-dependent dehydrogenase (short-subunit alcohol dehydrogenase family)
MSSLTGKVYAITGGASGMGLATAKILSERGAIVCIADRDPAAIEKTTAYFTEKGATFSVTKVDVSVRYQVESWIGGIVKDYGRLDGAANIAGVNASDPTKSSILKLEDDEWFRVLNINLTGTMYCLRSELNHIVDGGSIVNMGSIHSCRGFSDTAAYDASKHGVLGLTRAAAQDVGHRNIRVNCVAPGAIKTPQMLRAWEQMGFTEEPPFNEPTSIQRQGSSEDVAHVIVFLLSPESAFVQGACYTVDGGWK